MREYCLTVESEERRITVRCAARELTFLVLGRPLLPAAEDFKTAVGLWDNFSVANGMNTKAWTMKPRLELLKAAQRLLADIGADRELLRFDYQYGFSSRPKQKNSGRMTVGKVEGKLATISAKNPGQLYLELRDKNTNGQWEIVETRDLRRGPVLVSESFGTIKVYRRRNKIDWEPKLSQLIEFLRSLDAESIRILHHYPE